MKVILSQDVKALGKRGDVVNVSDGYANNYLLKNKLAVPASTGNVNINNQEKAALAKKIAEETAAAKSLAKVLESLEIKLFVQVGSNGKAFGSIGAKEISDKLSELGHEVDRKKIELASPIKSAGRYQVAARLYKGVQAKLNVIISAE